MSISLNTINSYAGTGGILLNAQQTGLESVGFVHRLKSFFNIGDAREKNRATLNALKDAVLADSQLQTRDLMDEVERLFEKEHTCFAVDMSRIRGIMDKVGALADKRNGAMLDRRVDLHMAAAVASDWFPQGLKDYQDEVTHIVKQQVRREAALLQRSQVDVAGIATNVCTAAVTALMRVHEPGKSADPELVDFVGRHLRQFVVRGNHTLRVGSDGSDEIELLVHDTCDFYWRAKEMGDGLRGGFTQSTEASANTVGPHAKIALEFMNTVGRTLEQGLYDRIDEYTYAMWEPATSTLGANPTAEQVRKLVDDIRQQLRTPIVTKYGTPIFLRDDEANKALARYIGKSLALELSDATCKAICKSRHVKSASDVFEQVAYDSLKTFDAEFTKAQKEAASAST